MALHDEALVRQFERHVRKLNTLIGDFGREDIDLGSEKTRKALDAFHMGWTKIFLDVEKFTHLIVFGYDTELKFYVGIEEVRGIGERRQHWEERLSRLSETIGGVHELAQQKAEWRLNKLAIAIAIFGIFQVMLAFTSNWRAFGRDATPHPDIWDFFFGLVFVVSTAVVTWEAIGLSRKEVSRTRDRKVKAILGIAAVCLVVLTLFMINVFIWLLVPAWRTG
jgi:hypothetical protein